MSSKGERSEQHKGKVAKLLVEAERLRRSGEIDRCIATYQELLALGREAGAGGEEVLLALLRLGDVYAALGRERQAFECWDEARERSDRAGFGDGLLECCQRRAGLHLAAGRWSAAAREAGEGREAARRAGRDSYESVFIGFLGQIERRLGHHDKALEHAMDGFQLAQKAGDLDEELTFLGDMALISLEKGDFAGALRQAEAGHRRALETKRDARGPVFLGQKSQALRGLGDVAGATTAAEEGLARAQELGDAKEVATFQYDLALLARQADDLDGAIKSLLQAYRGFLGMANKEGALTCLRVLARFMAEGGDWEAAFKAVLDAMVLSVSMDRRLFLASFLCVAHVVAPLWRAKGYDDILLGLDVLDGFFDDLGQRLPSSGGDPSLLTYLKKVTSCLRKLAQSRGASDAPCLSEARALAAEVDAALGSDLGTFLGGLLSPEAVSGPAAPRP